MPQWEKKGKLLVGKFRGDFFSKAQLGKLHSFKILKSSVQVVPQVAPDVLGHNMNLIR